MRITFTQPHFVGLRSFAAGEPFNAMPELGEQLVAAGVAVKAEAGVIETTDLSRPQERTDIQTASLETTSRQPAPALTADAKPKRRRRKPVPQEAA
jgi:hypothetical protein